MVCQWAKQDQTFCIGHLDGIDVAAKDKRAVMGLKDHAWVITTFLEEVLDKRAGSNQPALDPRARARARQIFRRCSTRPSGRWPDLINKHYFLFFVWAGLGVGCFSH